MKRLLSLLVSLGILAVICWRIDFETSKQWLFYDQV
jgi:hypothetical protein